MTNRQIEESREARLWIGQVIIPTVAAVGGLIAIPEVREAIKAKANDIKNKINDKRKPKITIVK